MRKHIAFFLLILTVGAADLRAVTIDWTPIGNPGNAPDPAFQNRGAVPYTYSIGTYEVTNAQYAEFLNAKDPTGVDVLALYNASHRNNGLNGINFSSSALNGNKYSLVAGRENWPANYITWYDAVRFTNWLNNGQGNGDTETGAYTLLGGTPIPTNELTITRNADARVFLPSDNELYKAAFYDPATSSYFLYATSSNSPPSAVLPPGGANSANVSTFQYQSQTLTPVGAYSSSPSPYGTFDQAGNVQEWSDTRISINLPYRYITNGSYADRNDSVYSGDGVFGGQDNPADRRYGFRVATIAYVPEPSSWTLASIALAAIGFIAGRPKRSPSSPRPRTAKLP